MASTQEITAALDSKGGVEHPDRFPSRHIGPSEEEEKEMLEAVGVSGLDELVEKTIPPSIRSKRPLQLPRPLSEFEALATLRRVARKNRVCRSYIGMGYSDCITPPAIQRNVLENPGWYTPYTPYQAEISQGRLESLLHFQSMIVDLTGMEISNASLLDEGTAAAEAMHLAYNVKGSETKNRFLVSDRCHPQTIDLVRTRGRALGIEVTVGNERGAPLETVFGVLVQYPTTDGVVEEYGALAGKVHAADALLIVAADLLSLTLLKPPGEFGADVAVGSAQRFGVPLGYGGPHAAFFATRDVFKRQMPGRLVGVSRDAQGRPGYRLSLQTREQHIRREKATSNICTAQALLANMAVFYAIYHGPARLKAIALRIHRLTALLRAGLEKLGFSTGKGACFDTIRVVLSSGQREAIAKAAATRNINLRIYPDGLGMSLDEVTSTGDLQALLELFTSEGAAAPKAEDLSPEKHLLPAQFARTREFLTAPVFNRHHSESEMMRYLKRLENRDLSLTTSMIPLGSCTMKLNAAAEMYPVSWPEFSRLHPFAPLEQAAGYQELFADLERWLGEITGFPAVSLQPNAGSQGEYAGLLAIHRYHEERRETHRDICLIPQSAHGTNPASAVMAGLKVVPVGCDAKGNIDLADLEAKAEQHSTSLAAIMITYPSTHGVFEETIREVARIVHARGGQVYMDGANMNAQVGLCRPAELGVDVCHLNLHKTFCIPHGGGGPGVGPVCVAEHLRGFLPSSSVVNAGVGRELGAVSAAPWGSASILPISWMYIAMMGGAGLRRATEIAILNANYIAARLRKYYPVLYTGAHGMVAHECILDLRPFKHVTVEDVAKRLMDYGFHAPTISWPVPGTMMIEPTESEDKAELDRFCEALIRIHQEIMAVEQGKVDRQDNVIKNAPHTADTVASDKWDRPYSREQAAFPAPWSRQAKFWPPVGRIDNVFGDRNLVCSCVGMEAYA